MTIEGQSQNELLIGHINHNGPDLSSGSGQAAVFQQTGYTEFDPNT